MKSNIAIYLVIVLVWGFGCKRNEDPTPIGVDYFPLEVGKYKSYTMDSIAFDPFKETADTLNYFLRETIESTFIDNSGKTAYRIKVEYTFDTTAKWKFKSYYAATADIYSARELINNMWFIALTFPVKDRKTWDENELNSLLPQTNRYINQEMPFVVNNTTYNKTITIDKGDEEDPFFRFYGQDVYAEGIGLIQEAFIETETQQGKKDGNEYIKKLYDTNW